MASHSERANLEKINSERTSLEILFSISRELATSLDLHRVLERVLSISTSNIGAERASLIVLDEKGRPIDAAIISDIALTPTTVEQMQDVITSGLAGWVIRNKKSALLNNTETDERWLDRPMSGKQVSPGKSALCIPVMAHEELVGVLTIVQSQINFFTDENVALQKAISEMAGIAIRNAELYEDVQNAHQRYYSLFEDSINPIFITDLEGKILEANHEASLVTGHENNQLVKLFITDLHVPVFEKIGLNFELIPANSSIAYKSDLRQQNNVILPVEVHVSQITINEESCLQWIFRDIQEEKKIIQLREDLLAMLYHDLRSPLANIISSLDIMTNLLQPSESESLKSVFDVAKRSTERMQRMIDGLLDINRLESGQQITKKQVTKLPATVDEAIDIVQAVAKNKGIVIIKEIKANLPDILIDSDMIRRVIINLIENSIKFSPEQSTVRVGVKKEKNTLQFYVEDQGKGIPEDTKEEIFEKFVRLKQNYSIKGLGLGLAFCKLAVQAHGGTIWVENMPQGGSRFVFTLPLIQHK
jgi:two-component system, NtrC family, sensor histidine kinase KinB